jgi:hypothetical protein
MQTNDEQIMNLIETIGQHYRHNLGTRYVRNSFSVLQLEQRDWDLIESVTEKANYYQHQGYHFDELYDRVLALGRFVFHARRELQPQLRARLGAGGVGPAPTGNERLLRDMAVNNFGANLSILADMVNELYALTVAADNAAARGHRPVHQTIEELKQLGSYLVSDV